MRRNIASTAFVTVVCILLSAGISGCWNPFAPPKKTPEPDPVSTIDRSSKMGLIQCFARAHENRDIKEYQDCLHELYTFWFWVDEIGVWPNPWIDRGEDILLMKNMFEAQTVTDIRVELTNQTNVQGAQSEEDNFWEVDVGGEEPLTAWYAEFLVNMHVVVDSGDEEVDHTVYGRADIYVLPDPNYEGQMVIWKIFDRTGEFKGSTTSWSALKHTLAK